jgi:hypothetical protein
MAIAGELTKCEVHSVIQMDRKNLFAVCSRATSRTAAIASSTATLRFNQDRRLRAECNHREYISRLIQLFNNFLGQSCLHGEYLLLMGFMSNSTTSRRPDGEGCGSFVAHHRPKATGSSDASPDALTSSIYPKVGAQRQSALISCY